MNKNKSPAKQRPDGGKSSSANEKARQSLLSQILQAKSDGHITTSIAVGSSEFEKQEFYGDSILYQRVSYIIMHSRRFMNPHLMTQLRSSIVRNSNLAKVFDKLDFHQLFTSTDTKSSFFTLKTKADVVEAIIGELAERGDDCRVCLEEFISYIAYVGEKDHNTNGDDDDENVRTRKHKKSPDDLYEPTVTSKPVFTTKNEEPQLPPSEPVNVKPATKEVKSSSAKLAVATTSAPSTATVVTSPPVTTSVTAPSSTPPVNNKPLFFQGPLSKPNPVTNTEQPKVMLLKRDEPSLIGKPSNNGTKIPNQYNNSFNVKQQNASSLYLHKQLGNTDPKPSSHPYSAFATMFAHTVAAAEATS